MTLTQLHWNLLAPLMKCPRIKGLSGKYFNQTVYRPLPRFWNNVTMHEHFEHSQGWMNAPKSHPIVESPLVPHA